MDAGQAAGTPVGAHWVQAGRQARQWEFNGCRPVGTLVGVQWMLAKQQALQWGLIGYRPAGRHVNGSSMDEGR